MHDFTAAPFFGAAPRWRRRRAYRAGPFRIRKGLGAISAMEGGAGRQAHRHALEALRPAEDDAFNAMVAAFKAASGTR